MKKKYFPRWLINILLIVLIAIAYSYYLKYEYADSIKDCPVGYKHPRDKGFMVGPGTSDIPEFIECGGKLVIERKRDVLVPDPNYTYVVKNYSNYKEHFTPDILVFFDKKERYQFEDSKLYVYSAFEGKAYYIIDISTAEVKKVNNSADLSDLEKETFDRLDD